MCKKTIVFFYDCFLIGFKIILLFFCTDFIILFYHIQYLNFQRITLFFLRDIPRDIPRDILRDIVIQIWHHNCKLVPIRSKRRLFTFIIVDLKFISADDFSEFQRLMLHQVYLQKHLHSYTNFLHSKCHFLLSIRSLRSVSFSPW